MKASFLLPAFVRSQGSLGTEYFVHPDCERQSVVRCNITDCDVGVGYGSVVMM